MMKIQKYTIYVLFAIMTVSLIIYSNIGLSKDGMIFKICDYNHRKFVENFILGVLGSSFVASVVAIITYSIERNRTVGLFFRTYKKLFECSGEFPKGHSVEEKVKWFQGYKELCEECDLYMSQIAFIFDIKLNGKYMKKITAYYMDFILLTQNDFLTLKWKDNLSLNEIEKLCKKIDDVIIEREIEQKGICTYTVEHNRLTHDKQLVMKAIDTVYKKPLKSLMLRQRFDQTLVNRDTFSLLEKEEEKYIKIIIKNMRLLNSCDIKLKIPKEICERLKVKGYLVGYDNLENGNKQLRCSFVLDYYFYLKKRMEEYKQ